jgi:hypothetical protein
MKSSIKIARQPANPVSAAVWARRYQDLVNSRRVVKTLGAKKVKNDLLNEYVRSARSAVQRGTISEITISETLKNGYVVRYTMHQANPILSTGDLRLLHRGLQNKKRSLVYEDKTPPTDEHYVGIEIEFIARASESDIAKDLRKRELDCWVTRHYDGSVDKDGIEDECRFCSNDMQDECECDYHTHELCVLVRQTEVSSVVTELCQYLDSIDAQVNSSCGMHVHLDMRGRNVKHAFSNLVASQEFLFAMQPPSRHQSTYCLPVKGRAYRVTKSKYYAINSLAMEEHNTLEVRMHSGTVDATKIINWVNLLVAIVESPLMARPPKALSTLLEHVGAPEQLAAYVEQRILKFEPDIARWRARDAWVPPGAPPLPRDMMSDDSQWRRHIDGSWMRAATQVEYLQLSRKWIPVDPPAEIAIRPVSFAPTSSPSDYEMSEAA